MDPLLDLIPCPAPDCGATASLRDRHVPESSEGPIEHVRTDCPAGHWFVMPVDMLTSRPAGAEEYVVSVGGKRATAESALQDWIYAIESAGLERVGWPVARQVNHPDGVPSFRVHGHARRAASGPLLYLAEDG